MFSSNKNKKEQLIANNVLIQRLERGGIIFSEVAESGTFNWNTRELDRLLEIETALKEVKTQLEAIKKERDDVKRSNEQTLNNLNQEKRKSAELGEQSRQLNVQVNHFTIELQQKNKELSSLKQKESELVNVQVDEGQWMLKNDKKDQIIQEKDVEIIRLDSEVKRLQPFEDGLKKIFNADNVSGNALFRWEQRIVRKVDLEDLEKKHQSLESQVVNLNAQITDLQTQLQKERDKVVPDETTNLNKIQQQSQIINELEKGLNSSKSWNIALILVAIGTLLISAAFNFFFQRCRKNR